MRVRYSLVWLLACCVLGCGGGGPTLYSVTGKVTLDGQPLPGANVSFFPDDSKLPASGGITNDQGTYTLTTLQGKSGAVAGKHKVTISGGKVEGQNPADRYTSVGKQALGRGKMGTAGPTSDSPVPEEYSSPDKTPFLKEVGANSNTIHLEISSKSK